MLFSNQKKMNSADQTTIALIALPACFLKCGFVKLLRPKTHVFIAMRIHQYGCIFSSVFLVVHFVSPFGWSVGRLVAAMCE
jgi:hypothetical protein